MHVQQDGFVDQIISTLAKNFLSPTLLQLEISESTLMADMESINGKLIRLQASGISISIDNFGVGFSSLSNLKNIPASSLKIDKSFILDIGLNHEDDGANATIVRSVIALGKCMNFKIIAQGVETEIQLSLLQNYHCDEAQGYLFAKPESASQITQRLIEQQQWRKAG